MLASFVIVSTVAAAAYQFRNKNSKSIPFINSSLANSASEMTDNVRETSSALLKQKEHHINAYALISSALELDENNQSELAYEKYKKGIRELRAGLAIQFNASEWEAASDLARKMENNLSMVEERINTLSRSLGRKNSWHEPSPVASASQQSQQPANTPAHHIPETKLRTRARTGSVGTPTTSKRPGLTQTKPTTSTKQQPKKTSRLQNVDSKLANMILNELLVDGPGVQWEDILGLDAAKKTLQEIVILPSLRPELFTGLRAPARGVLLYGPPGTGKTMLAKAVAHEANSKFFSISASSLTSKYVGESEKLVRALFAVAKELAPSIIFIDEIDSILSERSESEHEASRRLKTQFLLEFDGVGSKEDERILVMGATNRPQELDEAARRRFVKRIYVPLPNAEARAAMITHLLKNHKYQITNREMSKLTQLLEGYSGSDIAALAKESSFFPLRELNSSKLLSIPKDQIRPIYYSDFVEAMKIIRPSVSKESLKAYEDWSRLYGMSGT